MSLLNRSATSHYICRVLLAGSLIGLISLTYQATAQSITNPTQAPPIDIFGVYDHNIFLLNLTNSPKSSDLRVDFSAHPGLPVVGDWTGAGFDTVGTLDPQNGQFTLCTFNDTQKCTDPTNLIQFAYASPNNTPVAGRWSLKTLHDGIGTFDTVNGLFFLRNDLSTGDPDFTMIYGMPGDQAIVGDWNNQGIETPGLFRSKTAEFLLSNQITNGQLSTDFEFSFGLSNYPYVPFAGRWNETVNHAGVGLYDISGKAFEFKNELSRGVADVTISFGNPNDLPIVGHWQKP